MKLPQQGTTVVVGGVGGRRRWGRTEPGSSGRWRRPGIESDWPGSNAGPSLASCPQHVMYSFEPPSGGNSWKEADSWPTSMHI